MQDRPAGQRLPQRPAAHSTEPRRRCCERMGPVMSLNAGIPILVMPRLLNYIVAIYLIIIGLLGPGLFGLK